MQIYQSGKLANSGEAINITKPYFNLWTAPPPNGTFNPGTSTGSRYPATFPLLESTGSLQYIWRFLAGDQGERNHPTLLSIAQIFNKFICSIHIYYPLKPTVTNKCIHSRTTTIAANNPIRSKALPNRRMDNPPLADPPLCSRINSTSNPPTQSP
jgi:hypothetical protein